QQDLLWVRAPTPDAPEGRTGRAPRHRARALGRVQQPWGRAPQDWARARLVSARAQQFWARAPRPWPPVQATSALRSRARRNPASSGSPGPAWRVPRAPTAAATLASPSQWEAREARCPSLAGARAPIRPSRRPGSRGSARRARLAPSSPTPASSRPIPRWPTTAFWTSRDRLFASAGRQRLFVVGRNRRACAVLGGLYRHRVRQDGRGLV